MSDPTIYQRPVELLQKLIQFDTTNPPGNEIVCVQYIDHLLQAAGIETTILALDEKRPNLIARIKGRGTAAPLLMQGHVDVVTTANQEWEHPPFAGALIDDFIWGRGALDMKGGVAMMISAFLKAKIEDSALPGDVILTILSDEEAGGEYGAKFLVEKHAEHFENVQYALGEFGGFSTNIAGRRFYPIMIAEKQLCSLQLTITGKGGHGSMPLQGEAMALLGQVLTTLDQQQLPVHVPTATRMMVEGIAEHISAPTNILLRQLLKPNLTNRLIKLMGAQGNVFKPLLHNTVSPTILQGGEKINVHPSQIELQLDGRLLPDSTPDELIAELNTLLGNNKNIEIEVIHFSPGPKEPNMGLFDTLGKLLHEADPTGTAVPLIVPGVTDARFFSRLGIQTYGFLPMILPNEVNFTNILHAANERIPAEALPFGAKLIHSALQQFH